MDMFKPKTPVIKAPTTLPDDEGARVRDAGLEAQQVALKKKGRSSTILSKAADRQNFDSFDASTTG